MKLSLLTSLFLASAYASSATDALSGLKLKDFEDDSAAALAKVKEAVKESKLSEAEAFAHVFSQITKADVGKNRLPNVEEVRKFFETFTEAQVKENQDMMHNSIALYLDVFKKAGLDNMIDLVTASPADIVKTVAVFKGRANKSTEAYKAIDPSLLGKAHIELIHVMDSTNIGGQSMLPHMPEAFFQHLADGFDEQEQKQLCAAMAAETLPHLPTSLLKLLTPHCLAGIEDFANQSVWTEKKIQALRSDAFIYYTGKFSKEAAAGLTRDQVKSLSAKAQFASPLERCTADRVPLHFVPPKSLIDIDGFCLASYVKSSGAQALGKGWLHIRENVFDAIPTNKYNAEIAEKLKPQDKKYFTDKLTKFMKYKKAAANIPAGPIDRSKKVEIEPRLLPKTADIDLVMRVLTASEGVHDDVLAYFDADKLKALKLTKSRAYNGIEILDLITAPNKATIISRLSSKIKPGQTHACSLIRSSAMLNKIKAHTLLSDECIAAVTFKAGKDEILKTPVLALTTSFQDVSKSFKAADYQHMTKAQLAGLVRGDFCEAVTAANFDLIPQEALGAVDARCWKALAREFPADKTVLFAEDAFATATYADWTARKLTVAHLADKQLSNLSVAVVAEFEATHITELGKRATNLTAKQIAALKEKALATLSMSNVTADALVLLAPEQITTLVPAFQFMSAPQVEKIGVENNKREETDKVLSENASKFNKDAFVAWEKRNTTAGAESSSMGWVGYSIIGGVVVIVLATGFVGYRKFASKN